MSMEPKKTVLIVEDEVNIALGAQGAADVKAHHLRHHHVEQDEVGLLLAREPSASPLMRCSTAASPASSATARRSRAC